MNTKEQFKQWITQIIPKSYINWLGKKIDEKIEEISNSYKASFGKDVFEINQDDITNEIKEIQNNINGRNEVKDKTFTEYDKAASNGIPKAIIGKWYTTFLRSVDLSEYLGNQTATNIKSSSEIDNIRIEQLSFSYESDLQKSLISQSEELFPEYQIFGESGEGIEYSINGKRIDLLLEDKKSNSILAIELKAGKADFKVFGQMSMYLQLLDERFFGKKIKGIIIANEIDESLIIASKRDQNIELMTYKMELNLKKINKTA
jgi:hypothetical protein